jgi:hypothetical protein
MLKLLVGLYRMAVRASQLNKARVKVGQYAAVVRYARVMTPFSCTSGAYVIQFQRS